MALKYRCGRSQSGAVQSEWPGVHDLGDSTRHGKAFELEEFLVLKAKEEASNIVAKTSLDSTTHLHRI